MVDHWTPETPWFGPDKQTQAVWPTYVCRNKSCKSYGKSHPNCGCGAPSFSRQSKNLEYDAHGGEVGRDHFCLSERPHQHDCEYYADGGNVEQKQQHDYKSTLDHAVVQHELLGLLSGHMGQSHLGDPEKHSKLIDEAKVQHRFRQLPPVGDGLMENPPQKTMGAKLGEHLHSGSHDKAADMMHGHPLVGDTAKGHLEPILGHLSAPLIEKETHPEALRSSVDFLDSSARGNKHIASQIKELFSEAKQHPTHMQEMAREASRNDLKERLEHLTQNPAAMLEIGGHLGHYLPDVASHLGSTAATAVGYLNSLKPKKAHVGPLDEESGVDPLAQDKYERQLDIANQPSRVLEHLRNGTLHPQDLTTLKVIYPGLHKSILDKVGEELINKKASGEEISYAHRMGLSMLMGEPLDSTLSIQSMQAIINSAPLTKPNEQPGKKKNATAAELKAIDKVNDLYKTSLEQLQTDKKT